MFRSAKHLAFIRTLDCLCCGDGTATEAAHVRFADMRIGKVNPGTGQKPDDYFTVPLCSRCHREQHGMNEREFWRQIQIDPVLVSLALFAAAGDHERACRVVRYAREATNILMAG